MTFKIKGVIKNRVAGIRVDGRLKLLRGKKFVIDQDFDEHQPPLTVIKNK